MSSLIENFILFLYALAVIERRDNSHIWHNYKIKRDIFHKVWTLVNWEDCNPAEIFANLTLQNILPEFDPQEFIYVVSIMAF